MNCGKYALPLLLAVLLVLSLMTITACGGNGAEAEIEMLEARIVELERLEARIKELERRTRHLSVKGNTLTIMGDLKTGGNLTTMGDLKTGGNLTTVGTLRILPEDLTQAQLSKHREMWKDSDVVPSPVSITMESSYLGSTISIDTRDGRNLFMLQGDFLFGGMLSLYDRDGERSNTFLWSPE